MKLSLILLFTSLSFWLNAQIENNLSSSWLCEFTSSDIGTVRTVFNFEFEDSTFQAHTMRNADKIVLGSGTAFLERLFTKDFKKGSLLHIVKGQHTQKGDTLVLSGIFTSAMGNYYFNGQILGDSLSAVLTDGKGGSRGTITGTNKVPSLPLEKYAEVYKNVSELTARKIFNPIVMQSKEWKKFDKKMKKVSSKVTDDLEMVFAFFYYSRKLPFSHYALMKIPESNSNNEQDYQPQVELEEKNEETIYMKIHSFSGSVREMDSIMTIIKDKDYQNLIVDLRGNSGGSVAAGLTFAKNIVDSSFYGGVFLTQKYFKEHRDIPSVDEYTQFPLFSEANFDLIIQGVHEKKGLCLQVIPNETVYSGSVFVLTDNMTASTCEPIVYGFKQFDEATIIGETTAGAMLNGEIFDLESGFSLVIPTATYYTSDGFKIDGVGVKPDLEVKSMDALDYVLENLINYTDR